ncbi:hypothetical protein GCM10010313_20530 [Streptomyces violarus]|uniref:Uncharacterized protein n=1 Tax=Streptomyces violarus TaxID=67380 RepID=A0A7W4ZN55_9ACTN|nr:hypothetical protein [Streptomyces violarus]GHD04345.1 hypothetical protein GCM10010313_20530 [Streptomyces violarus]
MLNGQDSEGVAVLIPLCTGRAYRISTTTSVGDGHGKLEQAGPGAQGLGLRPNPGRRTLRRRVVASAIPVVGAVYQLGYLVKVLVPPAKGKPGPRRGRPQL